jgi:hypothetical protein
MASTPAGSSAGAEALTIAVKAEPPATIVSATFAGSISAAEAFDREAVGAEAPVPKRRRASSSKPAQSATRARSRSPSRAPLSPSRAPRDVDAEMALPVPVSPSPSASAYGSAEAAAPGTPPDAGQGTVTRAEMGAYKETMDGALERMFTKMAQLMQPEAATRRAEITEAVTAAVQGVMAPIRTDLSDIDRRMSLLEQKFAYQNAAGDGQEGYQDEWSGWWYYDEPSQQEWPEPTWAERVAKGAGKGKEKAVGKGKVVGKAKAPPPFADRAAKANPCKLRVSTLGGERVRLADIKEAVLAYLEEQAHTQTITFSGSVFGNNYAIVFGGSPEAGGACVQAAIKALKRPGGGGYRKIFCPSALGDDKPQVQLFFNQDKPPAQQATEFHFRAFKRAVRSVCDNKDFLVDPRDKLFSLAWRPIVQLLPIRGTWDYKVLFHNPAALELFTEEQQTAVAAAYAAAVITGAQRG